MHPSLRAQALPDNFFAVIERHIQALQSSGADIIRLDIGSPDLPPPVHILEALNCSAAEAQNHGYQAHAGPPALRLAWAKFYQDEYGVELDPEKHVIPLMGSKEGIFHLIQAWVGPGDGVLVPDPGYMTYTRGTLFAGAEPIYFPLRLENEFLPDLGAISTSVLQRACMLWLNYPNNPTGASCSLDFLTEAVNFARRYNLLLCHDAAYSQVYLEGQRAPSILEVPGALEVAVEFNSLSKSHNMPGWRLGVALGRTDALAALFKVKTNVDSGHFRPILDAAVAALRGDQTWIEGRNAIYRQRRDIVLAGLEKLRLKAFRSQASIYVWAAIPNRCRALDFVADVLDQTHVSLAPGTIFGQQGEGYVRIALTTDSDRLAEAMQRLARWTGS